MNKNITEFSNREALLHANSALIAQLQARLKAKRWRPQEGENIKISYIRALIQALTCQNQMLKDTELDEFKKRLETLENSRTQGCKNDYTTSVFEVIQ